MGIDPLLVWSSGVLPLAVHNRERATSTYNMSKGNIGMTGRNDRTSSGTLLEGKICM